MKLAAIGNDCIIHPIDHAPMSKGLIVTAEAQRKRRHNQGIVVAKGPLVSDEIEIADHVLFNGYSGDKIALASGGEFFVIPDDFIVAKFTGSKIVLMDTETVKRLLTERKFEMLQKYDGSEQEIKMLKEIFDSLFERVDSITLAEGFEF